MLRSLYQTLIKLITNIMILSSFLISSAFAAEEVSGSATGGSFLIDLVPVILVIFVLFFLIILPQQKKLKQHNQMVNSLKLGDKVCTSGGIFGTIKSADNKENFFELEIAKDVTIKILKQSVGEAIKDKAQKPATSKKSKK